MWGWQTMKKRISRDDRRSQLLDAAIDFIRSEGVDALTLGKVAKHAGMSKPLVYDHFGTREGLIVELCNVFDERQRSEIRQILQDDSLGLGELLNGVAHCYIASETARDWQMLNSAMASNMMTAAVYQEMADRHITMLMAAIGPRTGLNGNRLRLICAGLIGAADAVTAFVLRGDSDVATAAEALVHIFKGAFAEQSPV